MGIKFKFDPTVVKTLIPLPLTVTVILDLEVPFTNSLS